MKKFIIECITGTLIVCLTGLILYHIKRPLIVKKINSIEEKLEVVNLGTSHGDNFDYSNCTLNGKSVNREGNTLYYDLQNYIFLRNSNYLKKNAIVIIPVSYYVFGLDENRTDRIDDSFVNDFYGYLPEEQIFSFSKEKKNNLIVLRIQENFQKLFLSVKRRVFIKTRNSKSDIENHAVKRVAHHKRLSVYSPHKKNLDYLDSLITEILNDNNIPILVTTPYHYSYNNNWGREWLDKNYFNIMKDYSSKFNIPYLDYSHDRRLCLKANYFLNSDHLNEEGKKAFSSVFCNDIQKY